MSSADVVDQYFKLVDEYVKKLGLEDRPSRIWNCDEVGFGKDTEKTKQKVIAPVGEKNPFRQQVIATDHITMLACANAEGKYIPNAIIYKNCLPNGRYADCIPENWIYSSTQSGYINRDIFTQWFTDVFVTNSKSSTTSEPTLLILDNHSSHMSPTVIDSAINNNIEIIGLPAHTSHFLQPLDQIFNNLKFQVSDLAQTLGILNADTVIRKNRMASLLKYAQEKAWSVKVVQQAFARTGLYPLDKNAIDKSYIKPHTNQEEADLSGSDGTEEEEEVPEEPCKECGYVKRVNPLVAAGIITEDLQEVLIPPVRTKENDEKPKSRRIIQAARVLTGKEMQEEFKRKVEIEKSKEEKLPKKQCAQRDTTQHKDTTELPTLLPPKKRKRKDIDDDELASPEYTCGVCHIRGKTSDEDKGIMWVGCDNSMCGVWVHYDCLSHNDQTDVDLSLVLGVDWTCPICIDSITSEEQQQQMCVVCMSDNPGESGIAINCAICDAFHHYECIPGSIQMEADRSMRNWLCNMCRVSSSEQ